MNRLKEKWGIKSNFQLVIILIVFAITGSISALISSPIIDFIFGDSDINGIVKFILQLFVKVKYASLINIVYKKEIIPEFLFNRFNSQNLIGCMKDFIKKKDLRSNQIKDFENFQKKMLFNNKNPSSLIINKLKI